MVKDESQAARRRREREERKKRKKQEEGSDSLKETIRDLMSEPGAEPFIVREGSDPRAFLCDHCGTQMMRVSTEATDDPSGLASIWQCPNCGSRKLEIVEVD
ncbi:MAG: hypothetical protein JSW05_03695 [Candidatus Thorarchaeota archaeon]|nr:MAG: hypothetical protein JSW05_03695 [Candidatus Thorarchaeota archaeon]